MSIEILKIAYISLTILMIIILLIIGVKTINQTTTNKVIALRKKRNLIGSLILWQVYVYAITYSGILSDFSLPPRLFLLLILPLFIFTGIFIYKNRKNNWIKNIPKHWLISYQTFRILVEYIFVITVTHSLLNAEVTIKGYNYDMIFACTAPIIGFLTYKNKLSNKVLIIWNYIGLGVIASIIFLFFASIYYPQLFGSEVTILPKAFVKYPYVLVAGFLMPSAVFIHVLSIVQLRTKKNIN